MLAARPPTASPLSATLPRLDSTGSVSLYTPSSLQVSNTHASLGSAASPDTNSPITKTWTLQPRPKPGRKPAVDVPPTKRKAQNREAQRAFRERRAQRVGELEVTLQEVQNAHKYKQSQWDQMEQTLVENLNVWRERSQYWEDRSLKAEEHLRQLEDMNRQLSEQVQQLQSTYSNGHDHGAGAWTSEQGRATTLPSISSFTELAPASNMQDLPESCKSCGEGGKCACMEAVLEPMPSEVKGEEPMEIDFTNMGSTKRPLSNNTTEPIIIDEPSSAIMEGGCGFCSKPGSAACPCKEIAAATQESNGGLLETVSPAQNIKSSYATSKPSGGPRGGPGSCPACQSDPERKRFCQTLGGLMPPPSRHDAPTTIDVANSSLNSTEDISSARPEVVQKQNMNTATDSLLTDYGINADATGRMTCADAYSLFQQLPATSRDREVFVQQLRAQPAARPNTYKAEQIAAPSSNCNSNGQCPKSGAVRGSDGTLYCGTCDDIGCAPLEVDAASVLTAMRLGLSMGNRVTMSLSARGDGMETSEGSE